MPQNRRATLFPPGGRSCPIGLTWNSSFAALQSQHPPGREVAQPQGTALGYFPKPESVKRNSRWPVPPKWSKPQDFRSGDPPSEASRSGTAGEVRVRQQPLHHRHERKTRSAGTSGALEQAGRSLRTHFIGRRRTPLARPFWGICSPAVIQEQVAAGPVTGWPMAWSTGAPHNRRWAQLP